MLISAIGVYSCADSLPRPFNVPAPTLCNADFTIVGVEGLLYSPPPGYAYHDHLQPPHDTLAVALSSDGSSAVIYHPNTGDAIKSWDWSNYISSGALDPVPKVLAVSPDSLILITGVGLALLIRDSLVWSVKYPSYGQRGFKNYYIHTEPQFALGFDRRRQEVALLLRGIDETSSNGAYRFPVAAAVLSLQDSVLTYLPFERSRRFMEGEYGFATEAHLAAHGDQLILSYYVDPTIYVYDRVSGRIDTFGGRSRYDTLQNHLLSKSEVKDRTTKLRHFTWVNNYSELHWNSSEQVWVRLFIPRLFPKNADGLYSTIDDRQATVQIFDSVFCLVAELPLDRKDGNIHSTYSPLGFQQVPRSVTASPIAQPAVRSQVARLTPSKLKNDD